MDKRKLFKISVACASLLGLSLLAKVDVSQSAILWGSADPKKEREPYCRLLNSGGDYYYIAAYEFYDPIFGATSERAGIKITPQANLSTDDFVNLQLSGAKFNPPVVSGVPVDMLRYVLVDTDDINTINSNLLNNNRDNIIAATAQAVSAPTNNMGFRVLRNFTANPDNHLYLAVAQVDPNGNFIRVHYLGASYNIDPGLGATCDNTADVLVGYTAPNDTGSGVLIRIMSLLGRVSPTLDFNFNAELDSANDFKSFIGGTVLDTCCERGGANCNQCVIGQCVSTPVGQVTGVTACGPRQTIVGGGANLGMVNGTLSFTVSSLVPQPGIRNIEISPYNRNCTADSTKQNWTCSVTGPIFSTRPCLKVYLDGQTENSPTIWSLTSLNLSNLSFTGGIKNLCYTLPGTGSLGAWYGGLEAIIPFVKKSPDGSYNTYIKFINRYSKPAKVFAQPFKGATGAMILATTYIGEIPANGGVLQITADELASKFGLTAQEIDNGMAFKFLIRVPSQIGCLNNEGCHINPNDPYVEGIVVSTSPFGQRTIPLKFKYWKNGAYSH